MVTTEIPMDTRSKSSVTSTPKSAQSSGSKAVGAVGKTLIDIDHVDFFYGENQALFDINMKIEEKKVTALIGPSGCG